MKPSPSILLAIVLVFTSSLAASGVNDAYAWLQSNQKADGSWGGAACWEPTCTPWAVLALQPSGVSWNAAGANAWLLQDLHSLTSYSWAEADIPGLELYSVMGLANTSELNATNVTDRLTTFQFPSGGFYGWWSNTAAVEDAVSTSMSVRGLLAAGALNASNSSAALNYLFTLQNADGSINLTNETAFSPFQGFAPDTASTTAVALMAFKDAGLSVGESHVDAALNYLKSQTASCFGGTGKTYTAAVAGNAFSQFGLSDFAASANGYLIRNQQPDGGFVDSRRATQASNAMDTGAGALALATTSDTPELKVANVHLRATPIVLRVYNLSASAQASITITLPNGTNDTMDLGYNSTLGAWEGQFNETQLSGAYKAYASIYGLSQDCPMAAAFETGAPLVAFETPTPANATSINGHAVTIKVSLSDDHAANATLRWGSSNSTMSCTFPYCSTSLSGLSNGTYEYQVWGFDSAGNGISTEIRTVTIAYAPAQPTPTPSGNSGSGSGSGDNNYVPPISTPTPQPSPTPTAKPAFKNAQVATPTPTATAKPASTVKPTVRTTVQASPVTNPAKKPSDSTGLFAAGLDARTGMVVLLLIAGVFGYYKLRSMGWVG